MGLFLTKEQELEYRVQVLERQVADLQRAAANDKTEEVQLTMPSVSGIVGKQCHDSDCRDSCSCKDCPSYY